MKTPTFLLAKLAVAATLMTAAAAQAVPLVFTISGGYSASWTMDSSPTPDYIPPSGQFFLLQNISGTFSGSPAGQVDIGFYADLFEGGLEIDDIGTGATLLATTSDVPLYGGTQAAPTFSVGTHQMTEFGGTTAYTLTISAVPEPATVASMLAGLGLVGALVRRRKAARA